jgi:predicted permease
MPAAEARAAARRKLGSRALIREEIYRMNTIGFIETLWRDLRYTLRVLRKSPGYALVAVLSLALGIGANTAIFSLVNQVMLRMLPVHDPAHLVALHREDDLEGTSTNDNYESVFSYPMYRRLRDDGRVFSGVIARSGAAVTALYQGNAESVEGAVVSGNFFGVLGVKAAAGRLFTPADDDAPMAHPVTVLSHSYWVKRFAASPAIVGKTINLNGFPMSVVGVSAAGFNGIFAGNMPDIYLPINMLGAAKPTWKALDDPSFRWLNVMARLAPGMSIEKAQAGARVAYRAALDAELARPGFDAHDTKAYREARLELRSAGQGINELRKNNQGPLLALSAMVGLVLLIACANVASLTIARATARQRELRIRLAIGARRWDLIRQLLLEGLTLAMAGGALGLLVADWTTHALLRSLPEDFAGDWLTAGLNPWLLAFTFAVALLSGLLFSLVPALQATRTDLAGALRCGSATAPPSGAVWLRKCVVTAQVALSLVLVVAAGLFGTTLFNIARIDLGFRSQDLLTFKVDASRSRPIPADSVAYYDDLKQRISAIPGVVGVGAADGGPFSNSNHSGNITLEGYQPPKQNPYVDTQMIAVTPGFFAALGIPMRAGREFGEQDGISAPKTVVVNEAFAKRFCRGRNPLGLHLGLGVGSHTVLDREIVGIVGDSRSNSREPAGEAFYYPFSQWDAPARLMFYVRSAGDASSLGPSIRAAARAVDANVPLYVMSPIVVRIEDSIYVERLLAMLSVAFGTLATLLAALGLYGIVAFTVARRTAEIGLRMALGAQPGEMLRMVVLESARLALTGIVIGSAAALALSKLVESQLFGVKAADPVILTCAAALLALVGLGAALAPGLRAARINPVVALKYE